MSQCPDFLSYLENDEVVYTRFSLVRCSDSIEEGQCRSFKFTGDIDNGIDE
jgi:hypothetical protein